MFGNKAEKWLNELLSKRQTGYKTLTQEMLSRVGAPTASPEKIKAVAVQFMSQLTGSLGDQMTRQFLESVVTWTETGQAPTAQQVADAQEAEQASQARQYADFLQQPAPGTPPAAPTAASQPRAAAGADPQTQAMTGWLDALAARRPRGLDRLTDELLAEVGNPPIPSQYDPANRMLAIMKHTEVKTFGKLMAENRMRTATLAYAQATTPEEMEEHDKLSDFWKYVAAWLDQQ